MLMTKMAPLTVVLYVAVALQPMLAASVRKEDRVTKTSDGQRSLFASKRFLGFNPIYVILLPPWVQKNGKNKAKGRILDVPRMGRSFVPGEEESERGRDGLDPITLPVNPDRVCADVLRDGPLHEGLPFRLIQQQFQTADGNGNGALEKAEVKKFLDKLLVLQFCMESTA